MHLQENTHISSVVDLLLGPTCMSCKVALGCAWRALQEKDALAKEVEDLNSTVFSKSFKAPSAWAEREVKYKMERRAWEIEVRREELSRVFAYQKQCITIAT